MDFFVVLGQKNKKEVDPINALQNLTNQGTRNQMPAQMMAMGNQMGMGNANTNPNVLHNLINVCRAKERKKEMLSWF